MKVGDEVKIQGMPEYGLGKVVRFYANQGTVLVDFDKDDELTYCIYESLVSNKKSNKQHEEKK